MDEALTITFARKRWESTSVQYLGPSLEKAAENAKILIESGEIDSEDANWYFDGLDGDSVEVTITDSKGKVLKTFTVEE